MRLLSVPLILYEVPFIYIHSNIKTTFWQVVLSTQISNFILITELMFDIILLGTFNKLGGAKLLTKGGDNLNKKDFLIIVLLIIILLLLLLLLIVLI